tara:strand:- start:1088 stop:2038 length:951 start_codon:yes stop_codon:yes gene_type:complete
MRDALSLLDQAIAYGNGALQELEVRMLIGTVDNEALNSLIQSLINSDSEILLDTIEKISLQNPDYDFLLSELLSLLQKIAIIQLLPEDSNNILKKDRRLVEFANSMTKEDVQLYYQIGIMGRKDLYLSPDAKAGLEMIMIRMLAFNPINLDEQLKKKQITKSSQKPSEKRIGTDVINQGRKTKPELKDEDTSSNTWEKMINEMELVGLVNELARNCVLKSQNKNKIELSLSPPSKFLLNKNLEDRLKDAINKKLGTDIELIITIENSDSESPSEVDTRVKKELKNSAKEAVKNDPDVQSLLDTFDATIDQDSIQSQ